jgi:hypothetical protein
LAAVRAGRDDPVAVLPAEAVCVAAAVRVAEAGPSAIDDDPAAELPHAQTQTLTHAAATSDKPRVTRRPRDETTRGAPGHEERVDTGQIIAHRRPATTQSNQRPRPGRRTLSRA